MIEKIKLASVFDPTHKQLEYYCSLFKKEAAVVVLNDSPPPIQLLTFTSGPAVE